MNPSSNSQMIGMIIGLVIVAIVFAFRFRQMSKSTPYDPNRAIIYPVILTAMAAAFAYAVKPLGTEWLWIGAAVVVGGGLGWLRASTVTMSVDTGTGRLMAQGSLMAILFLVGLLVIRYVFRYFLTINATAVGIRPLVADVIFVAMAVGLLGARSLEMNIRGRKLLAAHRANPDVITSEAAGV